MSALTVSPAMARRSSEESQDLARSLADGTRDCGGAPILDLALCLIMAVTVIGLLVLAL